jgi:hypothetical protein
MSWCTIFVAIGWLLPLLHAASAPAMVSSSAAEIILSLI